MAAGHAPPERTALTDEMLLADELGEVARAHPGRERLLLGRWLEEGLGSGATRLRPYGRHAASLRGPARPAFEPAPRPHGLKTGLPTWMARIVSGCSRKALAVLVAEWLPRHNTIGPFPTAEAAEDHRRRFIHSRLARPRVEPAARPAE